MLIWLVSSLKKNDLFFQSVKNKKNYFILVKLINWFFVLVVICLKCFPLPAPQSPSCPHHVVFYVIKDGFEGNRCPGFASGTLC